MTTCKCRENNLNLVMTRTYFDERLESKIAQGVIQERERIIKLLKEKLAKMKFQEPYSDLEEYELLYHGLIALIEGKELNV